MTVCKRRIFCVLLFFLAVGMLHPVSAQGTKLWGGTMRVAFYQDPININGILKTWNPVTYIHGLTLNRLVTMREGYVMKGDLAKSWSFSDDKKSITFNLRNDVWWSDGVKFTSADVKWHYLMLMNGSSVARPGMVGFVGADTPDDYTVTFRFNMTKNHFNLLLPFGLYANGADQAIMPKHSFRWGTTFNFTDNPANVYMPVTGPFRIADYLSGQSMTFVRNPLYGVKSYVDPTQGDVHHPPYLDKLIYQFITSTTASMSALESGQIDMVQEGQNAVPPTDIPRVSKLPGITLAGTPYFTTYRITFNFRPETVQKYPWIRDQRVRSAFSYAIDRSSIIKNVLGNVTEPVYGPIAPLMKDWYNPNITKYEFNPSKANALLDEAGYKKDSSGVRFTTPWAIYASAVVMAEAMKSMLADVGIVVQLVPIDDTTFYAKYETGPQGLAEYPIALQTFGAGPLPNNIDGWTSNTRFSPGGQNDGFYNSTQVTRLEQLAGQTDDLSKIRDYYNQVQEIIAKEQPYVFLWEFWKINVWRSEFQGIKESSTPAPAWYGHNMVEAWWTKGTPGPALTTQTTTQAAATTGPDLGTIAAIGIVILVVLVGAVFMVRKKSTRQNKKA
ncbi:MAG TPA: ABC transporter substrate-binding protein [Candidatus Bathyarchaeia archaeon]|nr:ABC transporter substrate-binding protein [Candidatus Bathyarchaeia archaeon]